MARQQQQKQAILAVILALLAAFALASAFHPATVSSSGAGVSSRRGFLATAFWGSSSSRRSLAQPKDIVARLAATRGGVAGRVKEVKTLAEAEEAVNSAGDKLVIFDFTATWCGPCKMIAPIYEQMSEEMIDAVFLKVDVDENEETARKFEVAQMPTFVFLKDGEIVGKLVGANPEKLREAITRHL